MKTPLLFALTAVLLAGTAAAGGPQRPWRDLNHNGRFDPYEDARQPVEARLDDLIGQMTLEEKVGTLLHGTLPAVDTPFGASNKGYDLDGAGNLINGAHLSSFITRLDMPPADLAAQNNAVQKLGEASRLGIPLTISTDPRHHFNAVAGASSSANGFSQWPEPIGFAALGDAATVRQFARIAAKDYRAVGIAMALSPMADLATEPRWSRISGTFGADPAAVSRLAGAYVEGFQGSAKGLVPGGVATVVKHWAGYGAEPDGFDGHNRYGSTVRMSRAQFDQHVAGFSGALKARSAGIMPTYAIVTVAGGSAAKVGANFDRSLLQGELRGRQGYRGIVVSDWGIANDCLEPCRNPTAENPQMPWHIAMPWGTEELSREDRIALAINAGVDQIGGENDPAPLLAAVRAGKIPLARIDAAARAVLAVKFKLGLFDAPYVDPAEAARQTGTSADHAAADAAQRASQVLLQNRGGLLPLRPGTRVWLVGVDPAAARAAGLVPVGQPDQAQAALVRAATPFEMLHPHHFFGRMQHEGRIDFRAGDPGYDSLMALPEGLPAIFAVDMDRPAILNGVAPRAQAMLALFGASDAALLDVVSGKAAPRGRLPYNLPSSMDAVMAQDPAAPDDDRDPLFARGFGLMHFGKGNR